MAEQPEVLFVQHIGYIKVEYGWVPMVFCTWQHFAGEAALVPVSRYDEMEFPWPHTSSSR